MIDNLFINNLLRTKYHKTNTKLGCLEVNSREIKTNSFYSTFSY